MCEGNSLSLIGCRTVDLHYLQSDVNLHDYVLRFARYFMVKGRIDNASFINHEISWRETQ